MKKEAFLRLFLPFLAMSMLVSCSTTPYASIEGWIMRQNATPRYFAAYDVFYLFGNFVFDYALGPFAKIAEKPLSVCAMAGKQQGQCKDR